MSMTKVNFRMLKVPILVFIEECCIVNLVAELSLVMWVVNFGICIELTCLGRLTKGLLAPTRVTWVRNLNE